MSTASGLANSEQQSNNVDTTKVDMGSINHVDEKQKIDSFLIQPCKEEKGFEYKKSIFATVFAIILAMAIIFTILYTRCSTSYIKMESECYTCHSDAICLQLRQNQKKCQCKQGFVGNGKTCDDIRFTIDIPMKERRLLPTALMNFPNTEEISICFRFKVIKEFLENDTLAIFQSFVVPEDSVNMSLDMSIAGFGVRLKDSRLDIEIGKHPLNRWEHVCMMFNTSGNWQTFINGQSYSQGVSSQIRELKNSNVRIYIGEFASKTKQSKIFISELLVYSKYLSEEDVFHVESLKPIFENLILSWNFFAHSIIS